MGLVPALPGRHSDCDGAVETPQSPFPFKRALPDLTLEVAGSDELLGCVRHLMQALKVARPGRDPSTALRR